MELVLPKLPALQAKFSIKPFASVDPNKLYLEARLYFGDAKEGETLGRWFRALAQIAGAFENAGINREIAHSKKLQEELHNVTRAQLERLELELQDRRNYLGPL